MGLIGPGPGTHQKNNLLKSLALQKVSYHDPHVGCRRLGPWIPSLLLASGNLGSEPVVISKADVKCELNNTDCVHCVLTHFLLHIKFLGE